MKEIVFEEMSVEQKLGFVYALSLYTDCSPEDEEYALTLIKGRSLGAVWVQWEEKNAALIRARIARLRAAADYPLLILTDAESGMDEYKIGHHNTIGRVGREDRAYTFGRVLGVTAREKGYNVVCCPMLDVSESGSCRCIGSDVHKIASLAAAEARGMHDAGILTVGKHYPGAKNATDGDSHMVEGCSDETEEALLSHGLFPYLALMREGLLDGVMVEHHLFPQIDPDHPASLSKPVIDIIRRHGFDGILITDALCMMGVRARFGDTDPMGMAIAAGNDLAMMYSKRVSRYHDALRDCYARGILSDEALDGAVKRLLKAQHKVFVNEQKSVPPITREEDLSVKDMERDGVFARAEDGLSLAIAREGRYYFALMVDNGLATDKGEVAVDTFSGGWYDPGRIREKIKELFPNATVQLFWQYPNQQQCFSVLNYSMGYDRVIFVTYSEFVAYTGAEHFTHRVVSLVEAMQHTGRISTLVHFGNPTILGELPHIPRVILGGTAFASTMACLEVLAGEREAKGCLTYDVDFR